MTEEVKKPDLPQGCIYTEHANGIQEFRLTQATSMAWNTFLDQMTSLSQSRSQQALARVLLDSSVGTASLVHIARSTQAWMRSQTELAPLRLAILYDDNVLLAMTQMVVRSLRLKNATARFFKSERRQQAIDWLLETD